MGNFILYRRYMMAGWRGLTLSLTRAERSYETKMQTANDDYTTRNFHYVRAMDRLDRLKAREIISVLNARGWRKGRFWMWASVAPWAGN
jgi:hypothetical protein